MSDSFFYPPEVMELLVEAIPKLFRGKEAVVMFFRSAGVEASLTTDLVDRIKADRNSITKSEITRTLLFRLNERGDRSIRELREILKRVVEREDYSTCWHQDRLIAEGLVARLRQVVNVKDSFSRMNQERETEQRRYRDVRRAQNEALQQRSEIFAKLRRELQSLFGTPNAQRRGKLLESVLNNLFDLNEILVREAFTVTGTEGEGVIEQVDGAVEFDGHIYLVEMKWHSSPLGREQIAPHLVRLFNRADARGIFISASGYTQPAIGDCRDALQQRVVVLCTLEEIVLLLEREGDLRDYFRQKVRGAVQERNPFFATVGRS